MAKYETTDPTYDPSLSSLDPVLTQATNAPSPIEEKQATISQDKGIRQRLAQADAAGPTIRQRTQSEIIDLTLLANRMGNPFSIRWIPFEQLRDMTTDLMLAFGWWMTISPLIRADYMIACPDAQLAAAVDEAVREINTAYFLAFSNALWYSHQPLVKTFRLGQLSATYRDPNGTDPNKDLPVWSSSADALLWKAPVVLNPSHCLPMWNDDGQMNGFKFSNTPIPHFDLISAASAYGYEVIPGHVIDSDYAIWTVNEQELNFGSAFGSARTKRAYPYWWSSWFRWRLADRSYENLADPPKYVYYPVDFDQFIDPEDPNQENPMVRQARATAIAVGEQMRSGSTTAFPGTFAEGADGKSTSHRKWEAGYYEAKNNFTELDSGFRLLDALKLRAWFLPEQSIIEGVSKSAGGGAGGSGGMRMASQLADVHEESQQVLVEEYDSYINAHLIPQFIAANFPEKIRTPCKKVSRTMGAVDDQTLSQVLTLVGQVRGEVLPVDIRTLLTQLKVPLLNEAQMKAEITQISELAKIMGPPATPPEAVGTQGYNAGVMKTQKGPNQYYEPPQRIVLAESDGFMNSLPDTPHFRDVGVRSAVVRLRRLFLDRYEQQYKSFVDFLRAQATLHLAQNVNGTKSGLDENQAKASAAAIVAVWAASNAPGTVGHPSVVTSEGIGAQTAGLVGKIAFAGGQSSLKSARLAAEDFGANVLDPWVQDRVKFALDSIDDTVRGEVQDWLAEELQQSVDPDVVAKTAEEHFADFAQTHAARVVRTETVEGFNFGALKALDLAGVSQVQAHDASDGTDHLTDANCQRRNGKIYSVEDAMKQKTHPNDTLWWQPLSTEKLSLERVAELPSHLAREGLKVAYDECSETLYLCDELDEQQEQAMTLILGDQLALR